MGNDLLSYFGGQVFYKVSPVYVPFFVFLDSTHDVYTPTRFLLT